MSAGAIIIVGLAVLTIGASEVPAGTVVAAGARSAPPAAPDTTGMGLMEWSYDTWSVPWVQVHGRGAVLAPASHATLMVLACQTSDLERERRVRHLSAEECEHRMAAIRAEQDTALIFRMDLRIQKGPGARDLVRLGPRVGVVLEDDRGRRWATFEVSHGPVLTMVGGQRVKRDFLYHPPWMRGSEYIHPQQTRLTGGRDVTAVEHRLRFPRRDPQSGEPLLTTATRWIRLRLSYGASEWVATWTFLPEEGRTP